MIHLFLGTVHKQELEWKNILNSINKDKLKLLVESLNYELIGYRHHGESNGIINNIYFLDCKTKKREEYDSLSFNSQVKKEETLVLKLCNPLSIWAKYKTANEVSTMKFVKSNTTIPVPAIISYSTNKDTSLINCEYILMEYVNGKLLHEIINKSAKELQKHKHLPFVEIKKKCMWKLNEEDQRIEWNRDKFLCPQ